MRAGKIISRFKHINTPSLRKQIVERRLMPLMRDMNRIAPYAAVRALLVSMGYTVVPWQSGHWRSVRPGTWVVIHVEKNGQPMIRWVRNNHFGKLQVSDGRDVPRELLLRYALAKAKYKQEEARERAAQDAAPETPPQ